MLGAELTGGLRLSRLLGLQQDALLGLKTHQLSYTYCILKDLFSTNETTVSQMVGDIFCTPIKNELSLHSKTFVVYWYLMQFIQQLFLLR